MSAELSLETTIAAVADQVPEGPAVVQGDSGSTYKEFADRAARFARFLRTRGPSKPDYERAARSSARRQFNPATPKSLHE